MVNLSSLQLQILYMVLGVKPLLVGEFPLGVWVLFMPPRPRPASDAHCGGDYEVITSSQWLSVDAVPAFVSERWESEMDATSISDLERPDLIQRQTHTITRQSCVSC